MAEYYFNFPTIDKLTVPQQAALNEVNPIGLSGKPGTGKSLVLLWRHIRNHQRNIRSQLLTFTNTLSYYLEHASSTVEQRASFNVRKTLTWINEMHLNMQLNHLAYDEILVDEAQDLHLMYYEMPNQIQWFSEKICFTADNNQQLYNGVQVEQLNQIFNNNINFVLDRNYRNSKSIMKCVQRLFQEALIPNAFINSCPEIGEKPRIIITHGNIEKRDKFIIDIINQYYNRRGHNIAVLTPGANMNIKELNASYYKALLNNLFDCSYYTNKMTVFGPMKNLHITPFKSSKGLEFDTVIIPTFDYLFSTNDANIVNWKDFYVGLTRARSNLFLFVREPIPNMENVAEIIDINDVDINTYENQNNLDIFDDDDLPF